MDWNRIVVPFCDSWRTTISREEHWHCLTEFLRRSHSHNSGKRSQHPKTFILTSQQKRNFGLFAWHIPVCITIITSLFMPFKEINQWKINNSGLFSQKVLSHLMAFDRYFVQLIRGLFHLFINLSTYTFIHAADIYHTSIIWKAPCEKCAQKIWLFPSLQKKEIKLCNKKCPVLKSQFENTE